MNPFVFACITPHGGEIVDQLAGDNPSRMEKTRQSMRRLGQYMQSANPDTIIVITPHGLRVDGQFSIANCESMRGSVEENDAIYEMERTVDRELAGSFYEAVQGKGLPIAEVNFGTQAGPYSCLPLDWGVIVPLAFMPNVPIVVVSPTRQLSLEDHIAFGHVIADVVKSSGKRIGLIASCDWSHAHDENGPYGFHPDASALDAKIVEWTQVNDLEVMADLDHALIENAKPDGIWQALILAGAIPKDSRLVEFLSYEVPTYFGLLCAAYHNQDGI